MPYAPRSAAVRRGDPGAFLPPVLEGKETEEATRDASHVRKQQRRRIPPGCPLYIQSVFFPNGFINLSAFLIPSALIFRIRPEGVLLRFQHFLMILLQEVTPQFSCCMAMTLRSAPGTGKRGGVKYILLQCSLADMVGIPGRLAPTVVVNHQLDIPVLNMIHTWDAFADLPYKFPSLPHDAASGRLYRSSLKFEKPSCGKFGDRHDSILSIS